MDVHEAIAKRRSVRKYASKPIEPDKLRRVLEDARLAPSARNIQEWRFLVIEDPPLRAGLMRAAKGQKFVGEAPAVIVACALICDYQMPCGQLAYPIDVTIALDHIALAAVEEGLGTCWVGAFVEDEVKKLLGIPALVRVVSLMTIGYPASPVGGEKERKAFEEVFHAGAWA